MGWIHAGTGGGVSVSLSPDDHKDAERLIRRHRPMSFMRRGPATLDELVQDVFTDIGVAIKQIRGVWEVRPELRPGHEAWVVWAEGWLKGERSLQRTITVLDEERTALSEKRASNAEARQEAREQGAKFRSAFLEAEEELRQALWLSAEAAKFLFSAEDDLLGETSRRGAWSSARNYAEQAVAFCFKARR